jgi:hypothetical protein
VADGRSTEQEHVAAHHQLGQHALRRPAALDGRHLAPAAEHGDAVGDLEHLVELVRDDDDRRAARLQRLEDLEQVACLLGRQDRRRLVQDQHARVAVERLQDLGALLHADADVLDARVGSTRRP